MAQKKVKKTKKAKDKAVVTLEAKGDLHIASGRYANSIQVTLGEEEFVINFFSRDGQQDLVHVGRFFISPNHARRLMDLLKRQIVIHKKMFPNSPLKQTAPKRK